MVVLLSILILQYFKIAFCEDALRVLGIVRSLWSEHEEGHV